MGGDSPDPSTKALLSAMMDDLLCTEEPQQLAEALRQQQEHGSRTLLRRIRLQQELRVLERGAPAAYNLLTLYDTARRQIDEDGSLHPALESALLSHVQAGSTAATPSPPPPPPPIWRNTALLRSAGASTGRALPACRTARRRLDEVYPATDARHALTVGVCERPHLAGLQAAMRGRVEAERQRLHRADAARADAWVDAEAARMLQVPEALVRHSFGGLKGVAYTQQRRLLEAVARQRRRVLGACPPGPSRSLLFPRAALGTAVGGVGGAVEQQPHGNGDVFLRRLVSSGHLTQGVLTAPFRSGGSASRCATLDDLLGGSWVGEGVSVSQAEDAVDALRATLVAGPPAGCRDKGVYEQAARDVESLQHVMDTVLNSAEVRAEEEEQEEEAVG